MRVRHPFFIAIRLLSVTMLSQQRLLRLAAILILSSLVCRGQNQRDAIVPLAQGAGSAASSSLTNTGGNGGMSDGPISPGEIVHINVFGAPDFSAVTRVSESGDIAFPILGAVRIVGLSSSEAGTLIATQLKDHNLMLDPQVMVTVDSTATGITVLGEVHSPGIFPPPGKHLLSDVIAAAGGLTANTGRIIEISSNKSPEKKDYIPWDPTMHNTSSYDRPVLPGDRVIVRACGIAYIGGNVPKPGAYSLCGSPQMTLSEVLTLAGGILPLSASNHTILIRTHPDGTKTSVQVDAHKVLLTKTADLVVQEDDVVYVPASGIKNAAQHALDFSLSLAGPLLYLYH